MRPIGSWKKGKRNGSPVNRKKLCLKLEWSLYGVERREFFLLTAIIIREERPLSQQYSNFFRSYIRGLRTFLRLEIHNSMEKKIKKGDVSEK